MTLLFQWIKVAVFCAVAVGKHIYAIGGKTPGYHDYSSEPFDDDFRHALTGCARFDTEENSWQEFAPLKEARSHAFGVSKTDEDKIFIAGGFGCFEDWLKSCEVYNIATDEWQFIASLTMSRVNGKMELIGDTIYVLGGSTKKPFKNPCPFPDGKVPVEWYDQGKDRWIDSAAMPISKITLRKIPRNLFDDSFGGNSYCRLKVGSLKVFKGVKNNLYPIRYLYPIRF